MDVSSSDYVMSVVQTRDGGYILAGLSRSDTDDAWRPGAYRRTTRPRPSFPMVCGNWASTMALVGQHFARYITTYLKFIISKKNRSSIGLKGWKIRTASIKIVRIQCTIIQKKRDGK